MGKSMEVSNIREFEMKFFYVFLFPETFLSVEKASMDEVDAAHKQYMVIVLMKMSGCSLLEVFFSVLSMPLIRCLL